MILTLVKPKKLVIFSWICGIRKMNIIRLLLSVKGWKKLGIILI